MTKLTEMQAYDKACRIARAAMVSNDKRQSGPEWHPAEQDPLAWWCCVEACMSLYLGGVDAGRALLRPERGEG